MKKLLAQIVSVLWPPTKAKLHRLVSIAGTLLTLAVCVWAWLVNKHVLTSTQALGVSLGALTVWASSWRSVIAPKADKLIDGLDIPDGSTVTRTETTTATKTTTVTPASEDTIRPFTPEKPPIDPTA
jgi:hypothetical protein